MSQSIPFLERLDRRMVDAETLVCVGLDPQIDRMPTSLPRSPEGITAFLVDLVSATAPYAAAFKPNLAFYTALGTDGLKILADVCAAIPDEIPVILDCKVGDVGDTAVAYARSWFDVLGVDACTVNPYLGEDTLAPFFSYDGRGVIVICKTSNRLSGDLQDLALAGGEVLYQHVADRCAAWDTTYPASIGLVVGATYPNQLTDIRGRIGNQLILLPGVGAQGGDLERSLVAGLDANGRGLLASASRSIMYASAGHDFAEAAEREAMTLRDSINVVRNNVEAARVPA
jgi:orotidine-5'-phosphate decarboxylase